MSNSYRLTLILAVILLGIGGYVYFVDVPASEQAVQVKKEKQKLIPFDDRHITQLILKTAKEHITFDQGERGRWSITTPLIAPADGREVRKILRALTLGKIERVIQKQATDNIEQYGLQPPHMTVTVTNNQETVTLDLGNPGPFSSSLYVRKTSDNSVVLTTLDVLTFAKKNLYTFRLKDVLFFNHAHITQVELKTHNQKTVLHRVPGIHGMSPNWRFQEPIGGPADKTTIGILLMALEDLQAEKFVDTEKEKLSLLQTLGKPVATAIMKTEKRTYPVSFYQHAGQAYAQTSPENPLYLVNSQIVKEVSQGLFGLRDKRLLGIPVDELTIVRVTTPEDRYGLINQNDTWLWEEDPATPLNQKAVKLLVSRLADLPAEHRIDKEEVALSTYGLDQPAITIVATDQHGKERGRLHIGNLDHGLVYATGAGLPGVVQARSTILTQIPTIQELIEHTHDRQ
ncbi:MAG: hypothetical protein NPIRA02_36250 [Nitrospirales bacterium]|nr:MAG: hypothetical protein NPIRA02_36250 [Nitrospirales bacterium]